VSRLADIATLLRGANGGGEVVGTVDSTMLAGAIPSICHEDARRDTRADCWKPVPRC
jgi:hypothetical protein